MKKLLLLIVLGFNAALFSAVMVKHHAEGGKSVLLTNKDADKISDKMAADVSIGSILAGLAGAVN